MIASASRHRPDSRGEPCQALIGAERMSSRYRSLRAWKIVLELFE